MEDILDDILAEESQEQEMFEHFRYEVDGGQEPLRVDKYLAGQMDGTSRSRVQLAIKAGFVRANDKTVKANYIVRPRDVMSLIHI